MRIKTLHVDKLGERHSRLRKQGKDALDVWACYNARMAKSRLEFMPPWDVVIIDPTEEMMEVINLIAEMKRPPQLVVLTGWDFKQREQAVKKLQGTSIEVMTYPFPACG